MTSSGSRTATAAGDVRAHTVWLALGTNLGDRAANLARAIAELDEIMHVEQLSAVYETAPFGFADQPRFWNMTLRGTTDLPPLALLQELQEIERRVGRTPTFRMGPRIIDIDILLHDDCVLESEALRLPHPAMMDREFVVLPLADVEPGLRHPVTGESVAERARQFAATTSSERLGSAADVLPLRGQDAP